MHELHLTNAVGYGDSMSDVELFMNVGLSVSVNGDKHVRDLAHIHVESQSLWDPYTAALALCREHSGLDILLKEVRL
jgi:phosphoserine phosphatase